jgi:hypothetical protein
LCSLRKGCSCPVPKFVTKFFDISNEGLTFNLARCTRLTEGSWTQVVRNLVPVVEEFGTFINSGVRREIRIDTSQAAHRQTVR